MARLLAEWPGMSSRRVAPVTAAWRSPLHLVPLETPVTLPFLLSPPSGGRRGKRILVTAAALSLVVHGFGLVWVLRSAPLPMPAAPPIPVELLATAPDDVPTTVARDRSPSTFRAPPPRHGVRQDATTLPMPPPAAPKAARDEPTRELVGATAAATAAPESTSPTGRGSGVAQRVFGEGEVDLPARPLARVRPRYPEHARLLARESDVKLAVTVEADGAVSRVELMESGGEEFDREAREAVERVRFEPARRAGAPVAALVTFMVRFRLDD